MWQMIIGFFYRKTNLENNHNYLPHCPRQKGGGAYDCVAPCDLEPKINERSRKMRHKFFYGMKPGIKNFSSKDFDQRDYDCHVIFQNKRGMPVAVSRHKTMDFWKVQNGFSTVFFGTRADALDYCKGRFCDANGQAV